MSHEHRSPFMELPTEVRENILRYLLVASYTATEHNTKSKEYHVMRYQLLSGSDLTYHFHTSIMRTNRRIYEESTKLLKRENDFVCLTTSRPSDLFLCLSEDGMKLIASGMEAHQFSYAAMTVTVAPPISDEWRFWGSTDSDDEQPCKYIFCPNELPAFCRYFLRSLGGINRGQSLRNTTIHIDIHNTRSEQTWEMDRSASGLLQLHRLLDPLRQLHSFGAAQIEGPLSASYKSSMITALCKECTNAMDLIGTTTVMLGQGDELDRQGLTVGAINKYKTALGYVRSCCWMYDEQDSLVDHGPFPGLTAEKTLSNLEVRLLARIASTYFQLRMLRMAQIYVERALEPYHNRWYLNRIPWQQVVYAEVLNVSARIRYAYGHVWEAVNDLRKVQEYVDLSEEQQFTLEAWQRHEDELSERQTKRNQARKLQLRKEELKTEEKFHVICNGKKNGDRLLKRGRSDLAISKYRTILSKMGKLTQKSYWDITSGMFEGYELMDGIKALRFKVQASIAASHLKSRRFADVIKCTDDLLRCDYDPSSCRHDDPDDDMHVHYGYFRDWLRDQRLDYAKAYYCNSIALMRVGETARAVERMEKALEFDPEDSGISAQLMILRRQAEKEKSKS